MSWGHEGNAREECQKHATRALFLSATVLSSFASAGAGLGFISANCHVPGFRLQNDSFFFSTERENVRMVYFTEVSMMEMQR